MEIVLSINWSSSYGMGPLDTFGVRHDMELIQIDFKNSTYINNTLKIVI